MSADQLATENIDRQLGRLRGIRETQENIEQTQTDLQESLETVVADARDAGASWQQIGDELGITKQAAQQRFGSND